MKVKLVRDKQENDLDPNERLEVVQDPMILLTLLVNKLHEEVSEVSAEMTDVYEYADVLEVLKTLAERNGISMEDIEMARLEKLERRGGFDKGLLLIKGDHQQKINELGLLEKIDENDEMYYQCPECHCLSGDNWSECTDNCPVIFSPYYKGGNNGS